MIFVGIDPGEHTGFAVWDSASRCFLEVATLPLYRAILRVLELRREHGEITVCFEDARQRRWFARERNESEYRGHLMGAGAAKRDAKIWEEFCEGEKIPYRAVKPQAGCTKWKAEYWAQVTGWKGRTSEHARDASLLVFNAN